ncbi:MAG: hypothetical protein H7A41_04435 [Chlamydiales bacterium]|nr:hypothetical protein [Chlamydiia bacterium]MCP5504381.1 hypothetical protein [Chlamydiales bacterium]
MKSLLFFLVFIISSTWAQVTYVYNKDVEGRESKTTWTINLKGDDLHIAGESLSGKTLIVTTPERVTKSFSHQSKNGKDEYSIIREGSQLIARKDINGERSERRFKLGNDLWVQEFDFCFKPFILSDYRDFKFSIIHPKNLDLHDMIATKQSLDKLDLNGKAREAIKVKVTLTGFKKMFWHADLWFDPQSGDLLKYMATEGPNTPLSVITLFSKQIDHK